MKLIKKVGLILAITGICCFSLSSFIGTFTLTEESLAALPEKERTLLGEDLKQQMLGEQYWFSSSFALDYVGIYETVNQQLKDAKDWDNVMYVNPHEQVVPLITASADNSFVNHPWLPFILSFGLASLGALLYFIPNIWLQGPPGIKNHHIYHKASTNKGAIAWVVFAYLIAFYILLYFYPWVFANQIAMLDPISTALSGNPASRWFLYGFLYSLVMTLMGIRMFVKYRGNAYQLVRTAVVLFFQLSFAFLIPEILVSLNQPYMDFKNAWPLDYDFFFTYNIENLMSSGKMGIFMLFWGTILSLIIVPIFTYIYGKRWYCSWVCGCGGLAETLGDPYRQHSDKSLKAWKFERVLIHGVLLFAVVMTVGTVSSYFFDTRSVIGIPIDGIKKTYGFFIGSIFSGVIGTGFYPIFGNRVWCRFGCPLAAYMGLIQRFKSRFRITTNGGQCISCGNCSTYCEQGIDVRWYAQRGQNIVRSSCVGCGVCSAVCPRGVLKLENGGEEGRINSNPILIGHENAVLAKDF